MALGDQMFFLGRVIERMDRGFSIEANPKVHPRRDCRAWCAEFDTCGASKCQENANDSVAGERETSSAQDSRGKTVARAKSVLTSCTA